MIYSTGKKKRIIELLSENPKRDFSVDEICESLLCDGSGRSTVYRIVSELTADGVVRRTVDVTGQRRYQYLGGEGCHEHLHLRCTGCGVLVHLDGETSHSLAESIRTVEGFTIEGGAVLSGECERCRRGGDGK